MKKNNIITNKTYQFSIFVCKGKITVCELNEFKDLLTLPYPISPEAIVHTTSESNKFIIGKINAENKEKAEVMLLEKYK